MSRYEKSATLITSNRDIDDWAKLLGEPMVSQCLLFWTLDTSDAIPQ
jgi:DNA replication protein DnaC